MSTRRSDRSFWAQRFVFQRRLAGDEGVWVEEHAGTWRECRERAKRVGRRGHVRIVDSSGRRFVPAPPLGSGRWSWVEEVCGR